MDLDKLEEVERITYHPNGHGYGFFRLYKRTGKGTWEVLYKTTAPFCHCARMNIFCECDGCRFCSKEKDGGIKCSAEPETITHQELKGIIEESVVLEKGEKHIAIF